MREHLLTLSLLGIKYESSGENAFSKLVEKIRENQIANQPSPPTPPETLVEKEPPPPPEQPVEDLSHLIDVIPPPITMQPIIDKTASYVAKNG